MSKKSSKISNSSKSSISRKKTRTSSKAKTSSKKKTITSSKGKKSLKNNSTNNNNNNNSNSNNSLKDKTNNKNSSDNSKVYMVSEDKEDKKYIDKPLTIGKVKADTSSKFIPPYKIINGPAFATVEMNLKKGQGIVTQSGGMHYMDSHIKTTTKSHGGIFKGLFRAIFTTSSMFMTTYSGTDNLTNKIMFGSFLPGDIFPVYLKPNEKIMLSPFSLVCYTTNLDIKSKRRLRGLFVSEGIYQTEMINDSKDTGVVWLSSYGGYYKKTLKEGESFKLDNGLFLCAPSHVKYGISVVGGIKSSLLSGEGLLMHFKGPCTVYCQGRSIPKLEDYITSIAKKIKR